MVCRIGWILLSGALVVACVGCKEEGVPKYPVTGSLTFKGKPLEGAIVSFTPKSGGRPAAGVTDSNGKYGLSTDVNGDGALAGDYTVTVAKYDRTVTELPPSEEPTDESVDITDEYPADYDEMDAAEKAASIAKNLLPPKFANPIGSPLVAQVKENDANVFDFDLDK